MARGSAPSALPGLKSGISRGRKGWRACYKLLDLRSRREFQAILVLHDKGTYHAADGARIQQHWRYPVVLSTNEATPLRSLQHSAPGILILRQCPGRVVHLQGVVRGKRIVVDDQIRAARGDLRGEEHALAPAARASSAKTQLGAPRAGRTKVRASRSRTPPTGRTNVQGRSRRGSRLLAPNAACSSPACPAASTVRVVGTFEQRFALRGPGRAPMCRPVHPPPVCRRTRAAGGRSGPHRRTHPVGRHWA